jgi:hypothetical protein
MTLPLVSAFIFARHKRRAIDWTIFSPSPFCQQTVYPPPAVFLYPLLSSVATMPAPAQNETGMLDAYLERQTSRLTVTENYIWTILAVTWVVVVSCFGYSRSRFRRSSFRAAYPVDLVGPVCSEWKNCKRHRGDCLNVIAHIRFGHTGSAGASQHRQKGQILGSQYFQPDRDIRPVWRTQFRQHHADQVHKSYPQYTWSWGIGS